MNKYFTIDGVKKISLVIAFAIVFFIGMSSVLPGNSVLADGEEGSYGSWVRGTSQYDAALGSNTSDMSIGTNTDNIVKDFVPDKDPSPTEKKLAGGIVKLGMSISRATHGINKDGVKTGFDASISGIVMGNIVNGTSLFVFDLKDGNIYGIFGATLYVVLRAIAMSFIFVILIAQVVKSLFGSDVRGLGMLKESLAAGAISLLLLFLMPQIVEWMCAARDLIGATVYKYIITSMSDGKHKVFAMMSIDEDYLKVYDEDKGFVTAITFLLATFLPLSYLISYVRIAVQQVVLFGTYPIFEILSMKDRKLRSTWMGVFFTNIFAPAIDMVLLIMPIKVMKAIEDAAGAEGVTKGSILKLIVVYILFTAVIPTRNILLNLLGNAFGVSGGVGLWGAVAMGARAVGSMATLLGGAIGDAKKAHDSGQGSKDSGKNGGVIESGSQSGEMASQQKNLGDVGSRKDSSSGGRAGSEASDGSAASNEIPSQSAMQSGVENNMHFENGAMNPYMSSDEQSRFENAAMNAAEDAGIDRNNVVTDNDVVNNSDSSSNTSYDEQGGAQYMDNISNNDGNDYSSSSTESMTNEGDDLLGSTIPETPIDSNPDSDGQSTPDINTEIDGLGDSNADHYASSSLADMQAEAQKFIDDNSYTKEQLEAASHGNDNLSELVNKVKDATPTVKGQKDEATAAFNMGRAANLRSLDTLRTSKSELDNKNMAESEKISYNQNTISALQSRINDRTASISDKREMKKALEEERKTMINTGKFNQKSWDNSEAGQRLKQYDAEIRQVDAANAKDMGKINSAREAISESQHNIKQNNYTKKMVDQKISERQDAEKTYARESANMGMRSETYGSLKDFSAQIEHDSRIAKNATYKNFNAAEYSGVLTAKQRTEFERTLRKREVAKAIGAGVGGAAGIGVATAVSGGLGLVAGLGGDTTAAAGIAAASYGRSSQIFSKAGSSIGGAVGGGVGRVGHEIDDSIMDGIEMGDAYLKKHSGADKVKK